MRKSPKDDQPATEPAQTPPPSRLSPGTASSRSTAAGTPSSASSGATSAAATTGGAAPASGSGAPTKGTPPATGQGTSKRPAKDADPLRGSRASGFWAIVVVLLVVIVLLAIFVLQNTQDVEVSFFGWNGHPPLAAAMMIAAAAGLVVAVAAGSLRILQLRRRVKRERKASA